MISLKNDRLLRAMLRKPVDVTPIWMMRQAGRYLPEYRATRQRAGSFLKLCKTPELACEVTLQPLQRFPLDAAIIFSDILTIPDAMGLGLQFLEGEGPMFERPIKTRHDIERLGVPDPGIALRFVTEAILLVQQELAGKVPLIGFSGSPWTLAAYMVEGKSVPGFPALKKLQQADPHSLHNLLAKLADSVSTYLNAQIAAGVQVVMIFDTWGGILNTADYQTYSLQYMQQVMANLTREFAAQKIPVVLFTKGGGQWLELIADTGCDTISVDWEISLREARQKAGNRVALQGNLNPAFLHHSPEEIRQAVAEVLASYGHGSGHIFNLGHGILPDVPVENVTVLVEAVHDLSKSYHSS